jgi:predicted nuclease of predicted toxin-antitoxin system
MKFKFDENFDRRLTSLLEAEGHDVDTVIDEGLTGADDETVYETARSVGRILSTLDLDFANPFHFPPEETVGIIVIRPIRPLLSAIRTTLVSILPQLKVANLNGQLWIVEPGRVRVYNPDESI